MLAMKWIDDSGRPVVLSMPGEHGARGAAVMSSMRPEPVRKVYVPITSLEQLVTHLQWALSVELSTIPPYLRALHSVIDRSTDAAKAVRDVAVEEMLHTALVANPMNANVASARNREASTETTPTEKE